MFKEKHRVLMKCQGKIQRSNKRSRKRIRELMNVQGGIQRGSCRNNKVKERSKINKMDKSLAEAASKE